MRNTYLCGTQIPGAPSTSTRRCLRSNCACSMAWRFHAIHAALSPELRLLDGAGVHVTQKPVRQIPRIVDVPPKNTGGPNKSNASTARSFEVPFEDSRKATQ